MDHFFQLNFQGDDHHHGFWYYEYEASPPAPDHLPLPPVILNQSAFVPYMETVEEGLVLRTDGRQINNSAAAAGTTIAGLNSGNMKKRMVEFFRRSFPRSTMMMMSRTQEPPERDRCFRHKINEKMRRDRHKQSFSSLHAMLPLGTKSDKNSIMQMAAKKIQEMQRYKEELWRQNKDLEEKVRVRGATGIGNKMRFRVPNYSENGNGICGIDSFLEVLKCLKSMGSDTISIQSQFSHQELVAELTVQNKIAAAGEVENAVQKTLYEVEKKFRFHCEEGWIS